MRRRIYWLLPDPGSARRTMNDLLLARIAAQHMHLVAREDADLGGLNPASVLQTSEVIRVVQAGLRLGGLTGGIVGVLVGAVAAWCFPLIGDSPQWGMVAVLAVVGALIGAWLSSVIGASTPSHRLERFEAAVRAGHVLLMVDLPSWRAAEIESRLRSLHPEARLEGIEPSLLPAFP